MRVVMNRDEQRSRAPALSPQWRELAGGTRAIWPTDPAGGGTWMGATSSGLVLCLVNLNVDPRPELPPGLISRGQLIPRFVEATSAAQLLESVRRTELAQFAPFRLIVAQRPTEFDQSVWECRWDRLHLTTTKHPRFPACFVSSGLGDAHVSPRLELFQQRLAVLPTPAMQDRFHGHVWPGHEDVSVLMTRPDARTVSITTVEVRGDVKEPEVRMIYQPIPEREALDSQPLAVISPMSTVPTGLSVAR